MRKYFKLLAFLSLIFVANQYINAQVPKPYWAKNVIQAPESGNYIFVYGEGNGSTPEESKRKAFADAVVKGQYELGSVTIGAQEIATIENGGLDAAMRFTNRQIKITCQTDPLLIESDRNNIQYKTYVLIQMSLYADKSAKFYDLPRNWDCIDNNYYNEITQYNERMNKLKKDKEKEDKKANDNFIMRGFNQYFSFSLGNGITYGGSNIIGLAFSGRFGGLFGIEPHIGIGFARKKFDAVTGYDGTPHGFSKNKLTYSFGANVFVYKGLYLGVNYGVNEFYVKDHFYDDYDNRYFDYMQSSDTYGYHSSYYHHPKYEQYVFHKIYEWYGGSGIDNEDEERFELCYNTGASLIAGYKYYWGEKNKGSFGFLDFGVGVKYYSENDTSFGFEKSAFTWNIGIGVAF